tara:strand:- start:227 stop:475 length:249 start_codon:yes stop_codon:yes gene_type:complete
MKSKNMLTYVFEQHMFIMYTTTTEQTMSKEKSKNVEYVNSCLCGCASTLRGKNNELYCTACFNVVEYDLVPVKKNSKQQRSK